MKFTLGAGAHKSRENSVIPTESVQPIVNKIEVDNNSFEFFGSEDPKENVSKLVKHFKNMAELVIQNNKNDLKTISESDFKVILSQKSNHPTLSGPSSRILLSLNKEISFASSGTNPNASTVVEKLLNDYNKALRATPKESYLGGTSIDRKGLIGSEFQKQGSGPGVRDSDSLFRKLVS